MWSHGDGEVRAGSSYVLRLLIAIVASEFPSEFLLCRDRNGSIGIDYKPHLRAEVIFVGLPNLNNRMTRLSR
jgi:hypothetical protein